MHGNGLLGLLETIVTNFYFGHFQIALMFYHATEYFCCLNIQISFIETELSYETCSTM